MNKNITRDWLWNLRLAVRLDEETGKLYAKRTLSNRVTGTELGCIDSNGYVKVRIAGVHAYSHQIVWFLTTGEWPNFLIDHDNRIRSDNRFYNLNKSNHSHNMMNSGIASHNTSGVRGVSITKFGTYKVNKKNKHLGTFKTMEEAKNAYNKYS